MVTLSPAVMAQRHEALDSLDDFPTPPWASRALFEHVLPAIGIDVKSEINGAWEPACNRGLMAEVIKEYVPHVQCSDVHGYGYPGASIGSFVGEGSDRSSCILPDLDLVATNPPFKIALEFLLRALGEARIVALLVRTSWVEGVERYNRVFKDNPPTVLAFFTERAPMFKGGWNPNGSSATAYSWLVWDNESEPVPPFWIPPGCRKSLSKPNDIANAERLGVLWKPALVDLSTNGTQKAML